MKIICSKSNLLKSVSISLKAVPSKTTMPILECILIDATTNQIKFTTNDMELGIETIVEGTIEEKGMVALNAKIFYEIIRRLPDNDVTIKTDEKFAATITCEKAKFNIPGKSGVLHFDSQKEARRFDVLAARQARGQIRDLRLQVDFTLQEAFTDTEGKRVRAIRYKADFTYYKPPNRQLYGSHAPYYEEQSGVPWEFVVEDVKSKATRTAKYAMKKKMLKDRFGYDITEV